MLPPKKTRYRGDRVDVSLRQTVIGISGRIPKVGDANHWHGNPGDSSCAQTAPRLGCKSSIPSRIGGRGSRCHRIQGESKYYEHFIVTDRLLPASAFAHSHIISRKRFQTRTSLRGDIHRYRTVPSMAKSSELRKALDEL